MTQRPHPPMEGFQALVAAATSLSGEASKARGKQVGMDMIDPALQNGNDAESVTTRALAALFANPGLLHLLGGASQPAPLDPSTPMQQTRYGRISRPPLAAPNPNFLSDLETTEAKRPPAPSTSSQQTYEALIQVERNWEDVLGDVGPNWGAQTLAQAVDPRETSVSTGTDEEGPRIAIGKDGQPVALPAWPLPPSGPNSRKNMPKEEMLARRRARNRVAAIESRKKKRSHMEEVEHRLQEKENAYTELQMRYHLLEQEVETLRQIVQKAGLKAPPPLEPISLPQPTIALESLQPTAQFQLPFDTYFNIDDMDADDDEEFIPPSSPAKQDESDSEMEDETPGPSRAAPRRGKKRALSPETEDEDLFLPIVDVPIPTSSLEELQKDAMAALGVSNQKDLARLVQKMIDSATSGGSMDENGEGLRFLRDIAQKGGFFGP
ncbi:hypothetical protein P7C73_g3723, partial [Tremellales sp. Uapishka_1]